MYRAFELKLTASDAEHTSSYHEWYKIGKSSINQSELDFKKILKELVSAGKILDGAQLRDKVFPVFQRDVFISHSHNDQDLMYFVAGMLKNEFNLSVFADEFFWGSADKLLKEIDDEHCKIQNEDYTYSYERRNLTTSHVHIMLSAAIMKAIDQCEMLLFLNTNNSAPDISEKFKYGRYTMSPWIYQELLFASMVKPNRREDIEKGAISLSEDLKVAYKIPTLEELTMEEIFCWQDKYSKDKQKGKNALDFLYELKKPLPVME